ncbi:MAG: hypothetical protein JO353_05475 [Phycisphaerae bacterium]|nr:hypothetical protein [Phycisphaerae bacterium]
MWGSIAFAQSPKRGDSTVKTLYDMKLENGVALRIRQTHVHDLGILAPLFSPKTKGGVAAGTFISVAVYHDDEMIPLSSRLLLLGQNVNDDILVLADDIWEGEAVFALTFANNVIIWTIPINCGFAGDTWDELQGWQMLQVATPLDATSVRITLTHQADGTRSAMITDLRSHLPNARPVEFVRAANLPRYMLRRD